jgi:diketogulonate reductase-like aldo/keto reductase
VEENLGAAKIKLSPEEVKSIRQAINETELPGDQYPPRLMEMLYRDTPELS